MGIQLSPPRASPQLSPRRASPHVTERGRVELQEGETPLAKFVSGFQPVKFLLLYAEKLKTLAMPSLQTSKKHWWQNSVPIGRDGAVWTAQGTMPI